MIPQYLNTLSSSFAMWIDHIILKRGFAYENKTGVLSNYSDGQIPSAYNVFGSPDKQWVADSSITGAIIPSGVFANSSFKGRSDGVIIDYDNGRIISSGISSSATVTGAYSVKEFNVYSTNQDEESLIVEKTQENNDQKIGSNFEINYLPPYQQKIPAIFINVQTQENKPFAFGGMDKSVVKIDVIIMANDPYQLDGALSLLADTGDEIFKKIDFDLYPYTEQGDLKNNYYNYEDLANASNEYYFIDEVVASKMTDPLRRGLNTQLYIGFADFSVSTMRNPRANSV